MSDTLTGGCLCGNVRYRLTGSPNNVTYCHCETCRRAAGSPVMVWAEYPVSQVELDQGAMRFYESSDIGERGFCPRCGSSLTFQYTAGRENIDVSAATLDDPNRLQPEDHLWTRSRISWFAVDDSLPRYKEGRGS
jgi:hypothetical protein